VACANDLTKACLQLPYPVHCNITMFARNAAVGVDVEGLINESFNINTNTNSPTSCCIGALS